MEDIEVDANSALVALQTRGGEYKGQKSHNCTDIQANTASH